MYDVEKQKKQVLFLANFCTFASYFCLMIYVYVTPVFDNFFFKSANNTTKPLTTTVVFYSLFALHPLANILFGYFCDQMNRQGIVLFTTLLALLSCLTIVLSPGFEEIGIISSWIIVICSLIQGLTSMVDVVGAQTYLSQKILTKETPLSQLLTSATTISFSIFSALVVVSFSIMPGFNWRVVFGFCAIMMVGNSTAYRMLIKATNTKDNQNNTTKLFDFVPKIKDRWHILMNYFFIKCSWPVFFYFIYVYCGGILQSTYCYTTSQVIHHHLFVSFFSLLASVVFAWASRHFYSLKVSKIRLYGTILCVIFFGVDFALIECPKHLLLFQIILAFFTLSYDPSDTIFHKYMPMLKGGSIPGLVYALLRSAIYFVASIGSLFLSDVFGQKGILYLFVPVVFVGWVGLMYYQQLEEQHGEIELIELTKL